MGSIKNREGRKENLEGNLESKKFSFLDFSRNLENPIFQRWDVEEKENDDLYKYFEKITDTMKTNAEILRPFRNRQKSIEQQKSSTYRKIKGNNEVVWGDQEGRTRGWNHIGDDPQQREIQEPNRLL